MLLSVRGGFAARVALSGRLRAAVPDCITKGNRGTQTAAIAFVPP